MLLTEDEAKTKRCPFTFAVPEQPGIREAGPWPCSASGCMAWRWQGGTSTSMAYTQDALDRSSDGSVCFRPVPPDKDFGWRPEMPCDSDRPGVTRWTKPNYDTALTVWGSQRRGFCGLSDPAIVREPYPVKARRAHAAIAD